MRFFQRLSAFQEPARLLCCGAGLLVALVVEWGGMGKLVDLQATNHLFKRVGTRFSISPEVVLVSIDDASLQLMDARIGRWPWPRSYLGRLVQACDGAACIGVDILLLEQDRQNPDHDLDLARSLAQSGHAALAGVFVDELVRGTSASSASWIKGSLIPFDSAIPTAPAQYLTQQFLTPLPLISRATRRVGHANFFPAEDNIFRNYSYLIPTDQGMMPSLALATVLAGEPPDALRPTKKTWRRLTPSAMTQELIFYHQPFPRISAVDLLEPSVQRLDRGWALNKIILVGVEARGLHDARSTPLGGERSGLDIHATALSNLLQQTWLLSLPPLGTWFLASLFGVIPVLSWNQPLRHILVSWAVFLMGYGAVVGLAFYTIPFRLPCAGPLLAFGAAAVCQLGEIARRELMLRQRIEELQRLRRMLSNMLLHDLKSPVSSMMTLIESVLPEQTAGSKTRRRLESALVEGTQLSNLLRTLLDIERMEAGKMNLILSRFRWDDLTREIASRLSPQADQRRLRMEVQHPREGIEIEGDSMMLGRVLMNLLENALKHAAAESTVICRTLLDHPEPGWLTCQVMNRGQPIAAADQAILFELYAQARLTGPNEAREGFGLGLAFCKLAILAHHGKLKCVSPVSEWNEGANFEFAIPVAAGKQQKSSATLHEQPGETS
ncbi:MAG: CHASE2 domain-containing protein [Verrucomicrobia bacterium]|nr:CHASE2 domain-containing protein [Verrucomicrobiota bacterium]